MATWGSDDGGVGCLPVKSFAVADLMGVRQRYSATQCGTMTSEAQCDMKSLWTPALSSVA